MSLRQEEAIAKVVKNIEVQCLLHNLPNLLSQHSQICSWKNHIVKFK